MAGAKHVSVPQLVLAYILASPLNAFPIVGAAKPQEVEQNLSAFEIVLTQEQREWLNLETDRREGGRVYSPKSRAD